ncbi:MAG: hypothetical protein AAB480_01060 [Patescibacteria group bacterium]
MTSNGVRIQSGILIALFVLAPTLVFAQSDGSSPSFSREGVFGCSQTGSYSMSVGALSAVGGAFVPVNDAAVTLNTGYLVYKECVLRGIVDRMRENATANLQRQILVAYQRGRNGQPLFSQSIPLESRAVADKAVLDYTQSGQFNTLNPALRQAVSRAVVQNYMAARNKPSAAYGCSYSGNLNSVYKGNPDGGAWAGLSALQNPACDPIFAYGIANEQVLGSAAYAVNNMLTRLEWDNGNYPIMGVDADGNPIVLTPGYIVGENALQALQTGFDQLSRANDIDQMVGALFAGITSQVIGDNKGLVGLTKSTGGIPSYLDQVVSQSAQGLRNSAINAGIGILVAQQKIESQILGFAKMILDKIKAISQALQVKENACWKLVVSSVCSSSLASDNTCTDDGGSRYKVATSTFQFTQKALDASQVAAYQRVHQQVASSSQIILTQISVLIAQLTDTSSYTAQLAALQALDRLANDGIVFHTPQDVTNEQSAAGTLVGQNGGSGTLDQLVTDTVAAWADSTNTKTGWCNVTRQPVVDAWKDCWREGSTSCLWP